MNRRTAVLALLAVAVAIVATSAPVWLHGQTSSAVASVVPVSVTGGQAAPGVAAGGLVVAAAALALALARRAGAVVAAAVAVLAGALVVVSAATAPGRAPTVLGSAAAEQVGVSAVDAVAVTAWPWVAAALGALAGAVAVAAAVAARGWQGPSARHEAGRVDPAASSSDGDTAVAPGAAASGAADPGSDGPGTVDPGAAWDALSRGEDPT